MGSAQAGAKKCVQLNAKINTATAVTPMFLCLQKLLNDAQLVSLLICMVSKFHTSPKSSQVQTPTTKQLCLNIKTRRLSDGFSRQLVQNSQTKSRKQKEQNKAREFDHLKG